MQKTVIHTLVPSKNRAAQADLLIRSLMTNFNVGSISIIYKATTPEFEEGYKLLIEKYYGEYIYFIKETDTIKKLMLAMIRDRWTNYVNFCTDDTVYFRPSNLQANDIRCIVDDTVCSFSPRLGLNTIIQDYKTGELQPPLTNYIEENNILKWNYINLNPLQNFGYPAHQDGCLMDKDFFMEISNFDWPTLRSLEGTLALDRRSSMFKKPIMAAPKYSFAVNVPTNAVQGGLYCGDKYYQSPEEMNTKLLSGMTLSLDKTDWSNIQGSHQEVNLLWD